MKPNRKQELFIKEYLIDKNATRAAIAAGYSQKTARSIGNELLGKPHIQSVISEEIAKQAKRLEIKADDILRELLRIAMSDIGEAFDDMGQMKPLKEIPEDVRRAISFIEVHEIFDGRGDDKMAIGLAKKIKFWDKTKALEMLAKHLKLLTDKVEVQGSVEAKPQIILSLPTNGREAKNDGSGNGS